MFKKNLYTSFFCKEKLYTKIMSANIEETTHLLKAVKLSAIMMIQLKLTDEI